jgi:hypothetical protein
LPIERVSIDLGAAAQLEFIGKCHGRQRPILELSPRP